MPASFEEVTIRTPRDAHLTAEADHPQIASDYDLVILVERIFVCWLDAYELDPGLEQDRQRR
jgi:hypothetical protein